jgi:multiple sugar transport system substrate-binding protein
MKRNAFWLLVACLAVMALVIAGCAQPTEAPTEEPAAEEPAEEPVEEEPAEEPAEEEPVAEPEEEEIVITLGSWEDEIGAERVQRILDGFEAKYPNITIEHQPVPDEYATKMLTQIAAGTAPDVIQVGEFWAAYFIEQGGFLDLSSFIDDPEVGVDTSKFYPEVYEVGVLGGKPYLFNKDFATMAVYINTDLFDAAGIPYPEEGWTFDDFIDVCQELTLDGAGNNAKSPDFDADDIVQFGSDMRGNWFRGFEPMYYSFGTTAISPDGMTASGYVDSEEMVLAVEFYRDLIHEYHCMPSSAQVDAQPGVDFFDAGLAAMKYSYGPWRVTNYQENPDLNFAIVPLPAGPAGHQGAICWAGYGVYPGTEHPQEAYMVARELGTEPGGQVFGEHALANMPSLNEMTGKADDPYWSGFINEIPFLHPLDCLVSPDFVRCIEDPFKAQVLDVIIAEGGGDFDPRPVLATLAEEADACLAEE